MRRVPLVALAVIAIATSAAGGQTRQSPRPALTSQRLPVECTIDAALKRLQRGSVPLAALESPAVQRLVRENRARWRERGIKDYRVCVTTLNPLYASLSETDVRGGVVTVGRVSAGMPGVGSVGRGWAPFAGTTVENLFDQIESLTRERPRVASFGIAVTYDQQFGYPTLIRFAPIDPTAVFDADVTWQVALTPSPRVALEPVSAGEVYSTPRRGRVVRLGGVFDLLFEVDASTRDRVRALWPNRAVEIFANINCERASFATGPVPPDLIGNALGVFRHPGGELVYLMEFQSGNRVEYCPISMDAVKLD